MIAVSPEDAQELLEDTLSANCQTRHVLHHDRSGLDCRNNPAHHEQKLVARVISPTLRCQGAETLARRATREERNGFLAYGIQQLLSRDVANVLLEEKRLAVVSPVRARRERMDLDPRRNVESRITKASREAAASRKQIDGFGLFCAHLL